MGIIILSASPLGSIDWLVFAAREPYLAVLGSILDHSWRVLMAMDYSGWTLKLSAGSNVQVRPHYFYRYNNIMAAKRKRQTTNISGQH